MLECLMYLHISEIALSTVLENPHFELVSQCFCGLVSLSRLGRIRRLHHYYTFPAR